MENTVNLADFQPLLLASLGFQPLNIVQLSSACNREAMTNHKLIMRILIATLYAAIGSFHRPKYPKVGQEAKIEDNGFYSCRYDISMRVFNLENE